MWRSQMGFRTLKLMIPVGTHERHKASQPLCFPRISLKHKGVRGQLYVHHQRMLDALGTGGGQLRQDLRFWIYPRPIGRLAPNRGQWIF